MSEGIEPEVVDKDDEKLQTVLKVTGGTSEERLALIKAHSRHAIAKHIGATVAIVSFFGFMSTCVYTVCGGGG